MHKFSLENIKNGIKNTVNRFPLPMIISVAITIVGLILVDSHETYIFQQTEFTLGLALLLTIAAKLYTETHPSRGTQIQAYAITALLVIVFFFFGAPHLASKTFVPGEYVIQYILWILAGLVAIGFAPAIRKAYTEFDFWKYIARLGGGAVVAFAYSAVMFIGLAIAFATVSFLFNLKFQEETYMRLWIVIAGIVTTTLFLSNTPRLDQIATEKEMEYPVILRRLAYYILVPLVCIYFTILYVYTAKILITMTWPKGIVSVMILGFSGLGIFVYMILYPIIKQTSSFTKAARIFFILLIPQIAVLFYAVFLRINEYAWTPQRYMVVAGGIWLLLISLYVLFNKIKNLKFFFTSLFVFVVLSSFGPWGMFNVSAQSQITRLETILIRNNLLVEGQIKKADSPDVVSFEDKREISAIARYLYQTHSLKLIQDWTAIPLQDDGDVTKAVGIPMVYGYEASPGESTTIISEYSENGVLTIAGYDYSIRDLFGDYTINGNAYEFTLDRETGVYTIHKDGQLFTSIPLTPFIEQIKKSAGLTGKSTLPAELMTYVFEDKKIKIKIVVNNLYVWNTEKNLYGSALIRFK